MDHSGEHGGRHRSHDARFGSVPGHPDRPAQRSALVVAVVLTALIMLWFFHDPRMVLAALLPNLLPLLFIAGVMGYVGIDLKVSTAIIFSIGRVTLRNCCQAVAPSQAAAS